MSAAWDTANLPVSKLFGVQIGYEDNARVTEFDSGRTVATQRNSVNRRRYNVSYAATKAQKDTFFSWYENSLGGNAGTFTAPDLRDMTATRTYRLGGTPTCSGINLQTINMVWIEA